MKTYDDDRKVNHLQMIKSGGRRVPRYQYWAYEKVEKLRCFI